MGSVAPHLFPNPSAAPCKTHIHPFQPFSPNSFLNPRHPPSCSCQTLVSLTHPHCCIWTFPQPDSLKIVDLPARHLTSPTCCHSLPTTNTKLSFASTAGTLGGGTDHDVQRVSGVVTRDRWDGSLGSSLCSGVTGCGRHCSHLCLHCSTHPSKSPVAGGG